MGQDKQGGGWPVGVIQTKYWEKKERKKHQFFVRKRGKKKKKFSKKFFPVRAKGGARRLLALLAEKKEKRCGDILAYLCFAMGTGGGRAGSPVTDPRRQQKEKEGERALLAHPEFERKRRRSPFFRRFERGKPKFSGRCKRKKRNRIDFLLAN